jgi:uncharacterized protein (TIGR02453 family)
MAKNSIIGFEGISPEALKFLKELSNNNNKEWFEANRPRYENFIKQPLRNFVQYMDIRFHDMGLPYIGDIKRSLFRINRDTRFSANKDPYKTNLGVFFPFSGQQTGRQPIYALGLYFHYEPNETFIAGGIHTPEPDALRSIRKKLDTDWESLVKIINTKEFRKHFPSGIKGESLKRIPQGYPADHPGGDYLKMKQYLVWENLDIKQTASPGLADILIEKGIAMRDFLTYLEEGINSGL